jgi:hypothetical protein
MGVTLFARVPAGGQKIQENPMSGLIYLVGLVVVVIAVLSFFGMH